MTSSTEKKAAGRTRPASLAMLLALAVWMASSAQGQDWPMWRHDANRTGATDQELAGQLHLQWVRKSPRLEPAWLSPINQHRMRYDRCYEPVVMGKTMFIGSSRNDSVRALATDTGAEKWVFYADGPVRFAPVAWQGRLYLVSDDGWLYCLDAETGGVVWKSRGGPTDRKVLGNKRLISMWPARGAPVIVDDTVYWAASIWPFMGIFIYALDAETGDAVWENDGSGSIFMKQPHNSPSFGGVAPQGHLVAVGDRLLIPGGRSTPACYNRLTGELEYYNLAAEGKRGGSYVSAIGEVFFNSNYLYGLETGARLLRVRDEPVLTREAIYARSDEGVVAFDFTSLRTIQVDKKVTNRETGEEEIVKETRWVIDTLWTVPEADVSVFIRAGSRLYAGKPNTLVAIDIPGPGSKPAVAWRANLDGTPASMLAADDRLFVVTLEGDVYCFGAEEAQPQVWPDKVAPTSPKDRWSDEAESIIETTAVSEGYCLAFGVGDGRLVEELARQSELHVVAIEPDEAKVARARRRLDAAGLYGTRVAVIHASPEALPLPQYLASLIVCEDVRASGFSTDEGFAEKAFCSLRPYGGVVCVADSKGRRQAFRRAINEAELATAEVEGAGGFLLLRREGPPP
ncbi:MAG: PQQ-binding-like beta-propeller repeat protein, partial [Planctomycetes bacterium]|nr:PQQ-binding-like beta-propeller repeat protein [Planctomycetota bacterium]